MRAQSIHLRAYQLRHRTVRPSYLSSNAIGARCLRLAARGGLAILISGLLSDTLPAVLYWIAR